MRRSRLPIVFVAAFTIVAALSLAGQHGSGNAVWPATPGGVASPAGMSAGVGAILWPLPRGGVLKLGGQEVIVVGRIVGDMQTGPFRIYVKTVVVGDLP